MNSLTQILSAHLIIIISFLLCSCAKHSIRDDVIYKDYNFSYNHLMSNGVIIGGIASYKIHISNNERTEYSSLLSTILMEQLKDVHIINTSQLMNKIGRENYSTIMNKFAVDQILTNEAMSLIRESMLEISYIILAYIENENTSKKSYTEITQDDEGNYKTVYETRYLLTVEFKIYDVFEEQLVWNNIIYNEVAKKMSILLTGFSIVLWEMQLM